MNDVILHVFNWKYSEIIEKIDQIAAAGYGAILLPPILYSDPMGSAWWQRYQPKDYRILYSYLGNKKQLEYIIEKCHNSKPRLNVFVDMVMNHMANESREDNYEFPGAAELEKYKNDPELYEANKLYGDLSEGLFSTWDFNRKENIENWADKHEVVYHQLSNLPDLSCNDWVLKQHDTVFEKMVELGFDGFRVDAVKHISNKQLGNIMDSDFMKGKFIFGEILTVTRHDEDLFMKPFIAETKMNAYDFVLFRAMREAFGFFGSLANLLHVEQHNNALPWDRAVTFTVNHDLPLNACFRALMFERQDEHLANAFIFGRDGGVPLVFSDHNESASDFPDDLNRWANSFNRKDIAKMIHFHNTLHGLKMFTLFESPQCIVFRRGDRGIVAINKSEDNLYIDFDTFGLLHNVRFVELLHDHSFELTEGLFELFIPSRTAQMWLAEI